MKNIVKKYLIFLLVVLFLLFSVQGAYSMMVTNYYNYWYSNSEAPPTITWDPSPSTDVVKYHVIAQWIVGTEVRQVYDIGEVSTNEISVPSPRIGSFIIGVRAIDSEGLTSPYIYSNISSDALVDNQPRSWMITYYMSKPGDIIIGALQNKIIEEIL